MMGRSYDENTVDPINQLKNNDSTNIDAGSIDGLPLSAYLLKSDAVDFMEPEGPVANPNMFALDGCSVVSYENGLHVIEIGDIIHNDMFLDTPNVIYVDILFSSTLNTYLTLEFKKGVKRIAPDPFWVDNITLRARMYHKGTEVVSELYGPYVVNTSNVKLMDSVVFHGLDNDKPISLVPNITVTRNGSVTNTTVQYDKVMLEIVEVNTGNVIYKDTRPPEESMVFQIPPNVLAPRTRYKLIATPMVGDVLNHYTATIEVTTLPCGINVHNVFMLPTPKYGVSSAISDNNESVLIAGGSSSDQFTDSTPIRAYLPKTNEVISRFGGELTYQSLISYGDNKYFLAGGIVNTDGSVNNLTHTLSVDIATKTINFELTGSLNTPVYRADMAYSTALGVYLFGGIDGVTGQTSAKIQYTQVPDTSANMSLRSDITLPEPLYDLSVVNLDRYSFLITGGIAAGGRMTDKCYILSFSTRTFIEAPPLLRPTAGHSTVKLKDGRIVVLGGYAPNFVEDVPNAHGSSDIYIYDIHNGNHIILPPLPTPISLAHACATDKIFMAGGAKILPSSATSRCSFLTV